MSEYVRGPVLYIVGAFLALTFVILFIALFAGIGSPITPAISTALGSTGTAYNDILPAIGLLLACGIILGGISRKGR